MTSLNVNIPSNILIIGKRQCGKTELVKKLISIIPHQNVYVLGTDNDIPCTYQTNDISNIIGKLPQEFNGQYNILVVQENQLCNSNTTNILNYTFPSTTIIMIVQTIYTVLPQYRHTFDYVYMFKCSVINEVIKIYESFLRSYMNIDVFTELYDQLKPYDILKIEAKKGQINKINACDIIPV